jgi:ABC-2 type transport system ATP-binding protein
MSSKSTPKPSIIVDGVSKWFRKRNSRSLKEAFINKAKRKAVRAERFQALDDVSFTVYEGESVAVMGLNGSGKSTTLKLISGVLEPDKGEVLTRGRVAGLIEVGAGFHPELTGRENVFLNAAILGMSEKETQARFDEIIEFSGIGDFIDQAVKSYSSGMYMRLAFSVAVHVERDVLLVDEVLAVGDALFRAKCHERLKELSKQGVTMLVVSHNKQQILEVCTRGIVLQKGKVIFDGDIKEAVELLETT